MAVDVASFKVAFPEFAKAADPQLTAKLAMVELQVSPDSWGDLRDTVVMLTLADQLACSPLGRDAQLAAGEQPQATTYRKQLWDLMKGNSFARAEARLGTVVDQQLALAYWEDCP